MDIATHYLPPKLETTLFVKLNSLQITLYQKILQSNQMKSLLFAKEVNQAQVLSMIGLLRKVILSPKLLMGQESVWNQLGIEWPTLLEETHSKELIEGCK